MLPDIFLQCKKDKAMQKRALIKSLTLKDCWVNCYVCYVSSHILCFSFVFLLIFPLQVRTKFVDEANFLLRLLIINIKYCALLLERVRIRKIT